jgi:Na+/H+ antiporter NhaC
MESENTKPLEFYGGVPILLLPFLVMIAGIIVLGISGMALPEAFWPMVLAGLLTGLFLAKDKHDYVRALISGISQSMLSVILLAWFLAGIMGKLLNETGIIEGLVWLFLEIGVTAAWFPLIAFIASSILSMSTGTSIGTIIAASPILFPVGHALGADPLLLVGAIIGGGFVGDNLAPISDTTIVSAYSQGTDIKTVVRTRVKYAVAAGILTLLAYILFAFISPGGEPAADSGQLSPKGLIMLLVPVTLIFLMIRGQHFVTALLYCTFGGMILGLLAGLLTFSDILVVDKEQFTAGGIIVSGLMSMNGIAVFTIFLMGLIGTLQQGNFIEWLMKKSEQFATTPRRAEIAIVFVSLIVNALTTAGTPTMVMLGPWVRRLGHKFKITPWRRGNLLDACSTTIIGFLPYSVAVLIPFAFVGGTVNDPGFTPVAVFPYVFYCWALMLVIIFAAFSGWGRDFIDEAEYRREAREIYISPNTGMNNSV